MKYYNINIYTVFVKRQNHPLLALKYGLSDNF
jgi:hypothetical protein